jgi:hypothetical protein
LFCRRFGQTSLNASKMQQFESPVLRVALVVTVNSQANKNAQPRSRVGRFPFCFAPSRCNYHPAFIAPGCLPRRLCLSLAPLLDQDRAAQRLPMSLAWRLTIGAEVLDGHLFGSAAHGSATNRAFALPVFRLIRSATLAGQHTGLLCGHDSATRDEPVATNADQNAGDSPLAASLGRS